MRIFLIVFVLVAGLVQSSMSQAKSNIAQLLGFDADAKLLIMHADDLGVAHAVNEASIAAFDAGGISSSSIMVPCPWFSEIAEYASQHPEYCWGLHLTLTAEWKYYKWDGVSPSSEISSLLNEAGHFYDNVAEFVENARLEEVEREVRAQIERALKSGIVVSHLDSHMGSLFANVDLLKIYVRLGNEYNLPVMIPGAMLPPSWKEQLEMGPYQWPIDNLMMLQAHPNDWGTQYNSLIDNAKPGLNEIIVHLGYDNDEMKAVMLDHPAFGSAWRQKDFNYVMSAEYKERLQSNNIHLVSYRQIKDAIDSNH